MWLVATLLDSIGLDFPMMDVKTDFCMMKTCIKDSVMETAIKTIKNQSITY